MPLPGRGATAGHPRESLTFSLLHSLARDHALVDGNKRLALAATIAFLGVNGVRPTLTDDEAYELVMAVATGQLNEIPDLAEQLRLRGDPGTYAGQCPSGSGQGLGPYLRECLGEHAAADL